MFRPRITRVVPSARRFSDKKPWDFEINKQQKPHTFGKITAFFKEAFASNKGATTTATKHPDVSTVYRQQIQKENDKLDEKAVDSVKQGILQMIEKGINKKYFREDRLEAFFEACFSLSQEHAQQLMQDPKFKEFVYKDAKTIVQLVNGSDNLEKFTKFMVFFRVDEDPELLEYLSYNILKKMPYFTVDEMLTIMVNLQHTLTPECMTVTKQMNAEFVERLNQNYNPKAQDLYIQGEDLIKITVAMLNNNTMEDGLKQSMMDHIIDNMSNLTYEVTAELAVVYAVKMDNTYKQMFFAHTRDKFIKELKYLKEATLYKILWALLKAEQLKMSDDSPEWLLIKQTLKDMSKDLSPGVIADILLLSTMEGAQQGPQKSGDLFSAFEADLILKMKAMSLDDLINLMWSGLELGKGSAMFYETLESELGKRIRGIKDEQFESLIGCFCGENEAVSKFSNKFLKLVLHVIKEKKDRFALKTLVQVIWACAKIDFTSDQFEILPLLQELAAYDRLRQGLPSMYVKSQAILLWTYTRDDRLLNDESCQKFIHAVLDSMLMYPSASMDNFDLTLIVQSITNTRNSSCQVFAQKLFMLAHHSDASVVRNIENMSIHEFVTISQFYLANLQICSKPLQTQLLTKIQNSVQEFNEMQLVILKTTIEYMFLEEKKVKLKKELMFDGSLDLVEDTYKEVLIELNELREEKALIDAEERITLEVRRRIHEIKQQQELEGGSVVKKQGDSQVQQKLDQKMTQNSTAVQDEPAPESGDGLGELIEDSKQRLKKYLLTK